MSRQGEERDSRPDSKSWEPGMPQPNFYNYKSTPESHRRYQIDVANYERYQEKVKEAEKAFVAMKQKHQDDRSLTMEEIRETFAQEATWKNLPDPVEAARDIQALKDENAALQGKIAMLTKYKNPKPTVDIVVVFQRHNLVLMIQRGKAPFGLAFPGGFVNEGESLEEAAARELFEETGLKVEAKELTQIHTYSRPDRDPRQHTISTSFLLVTNYGIADLKAGDDASALEFHDVRDVELGTLGMCFDHRQIGIDALTVFNFGDRPDTGDNIVR